MILWAFTSIALGYEVVVSDPKELGNILCLS